MSKKIVYVSIPSAMKIMPIIYFIVSIIVGILSAIFLTFFSSNNFGMVDLIIGILLYGLLLCGIFSFITFLGIYFYNLLVQKIGGIEIDSIEK